ncbi:DUF5667 domain-containing protein [Nanoarchaeota archaeon]
MKQFIAMFFVFLMVVTAVPVVIAEEETAEPVLISANEGEEYGWGARTMDRIRLAFAFKEERKLEVMNKIQERREQHFRVLLAKGKQEQATRFSEGTAALTQNFEQKRERIQQRLQEKEQSMEQTQEREQIRDPTTHEVPVQTPKGGK